MIVLKFGGSSVSTLDKIDRAISIAHACLDEHPVLVSSAMGDTTDYLVDITRSAAVGSREATRRSLERIRETHLEAVRHLETAGIQAACMADIEAHLQEIESLATGVSLIQECSPRTQDAILAFGEILSTRIIAARALDRGINTRLVDSRDFIFTDERFTHAQVDIEQTYSAIRSALTPESEQLIIAQGFIGRTHSGVTSTLGRGGSDYSASLIGAALDAERVEIWTDVDGIMTTDPRLIPAARTVANMSYDEAAELAFFGARVVHPSTIQPAVDRNIAVFVRNTGRPDGSGTKISGTISATGVRALATKSDITVITVRSSRMLNAYGFLAQIFAVFDRHRISVDLVTTSEVSVSMSVDDDRNLDELRTELSSLGHVEIERSQAIVSIVGQDIWKDSRTVARVFGVLAGIPIRMVSLGNSDVNLSMVVPSQRVSDTVSRLHEEFFERG
ncbi:MAG: lysine-sensitive aspartokinase 3 [Spirochaetaceae bacterium]